MVLTSRSPRLPLPLWARPACPPTPTLPPLSVPLRRPSMSTVSLRKTSPRLESWPSVSSQFNLPAVLSVLLIVSYHRNLRVYRPRRWIPRLGPPDTACYRGRPQARNLQQVPRLHGEARLQGRIHRYVSLLISPIPISSWTYVVLYLCCGSVANEPNAKVSGVIGGTLAQATNKAKEIDQQRGISSFFLDYYSKAMNTNTGQK